MDPDALSTHQQSQSPDAGAGANDAVEEFADTALSAAEELERADLARLAAEAESGAAGGNETGAEDARQSLHELDASVSHDINALLEGSFDAVDDVLNDVLDDVFETKAFLKEDGVGDAEPDELDDVVAESTEPTRAAKPAAKVATESQTPPSDPAGESEPVAAGGPPSDAEEEPVEDADAEPQNLAASKDDPSTLFYVGRQIYSSADPETATPPEESQGPLVLKRVATKAEHSPFGRSMKRILSMISIPIRYVPERRRHLVDWLALSLAFWTPIVWLILFFTSH